MACVTVTLKDGSTILANVKPGQTLTDKDIEMLSEFHELLKIQKEAEAGVELRPIPTGRGKNTQSSLPRRKPTQ